MPKMNGIDLSIQILELDTNVKICFITAGDANIEVLRELSYQKYRVLYQKASYNREPS
jgi:two-component SAPR family response regulator